jgi:hypothetical protein
LQSIRTGAGPFHYDLAGAIVEAGTRLQARNETFNVASSEVFSFGEVVGVLTELAGRRNNIRSGARAAWSLSDVLKYDVSKGTAAPRLHPAHDTKGVDCA